ncbi:hypothetical protein NKH24_10245 [Mesorhizobium sp. M1300]
MANDVWRTSCVGRNLQSVMHSGPKAEHSKLIAAEAEGAMTPGSDITNEG